MTRLGSILAVLVLLAACHGETTDIGTPTTASSATPTSLEPCGYTDQESFHPPEEKCELLGPTASTLTTQTASSSTLVPTTPTTLVDVDQAVLDLSTPTVRPTNTSTTWPTTTSTGRSVLAQLLAEEAYLEERARLFAWQVSASIDEIRPFLFDNPDLPDMADRLLAEGYRFCEYLDAVAEIEGVTRAEREAAVELHVEWLEDEESAITGVLPAPHAQILAAAVEYLCPHQSDLLD